MRRLFAKLALLVASVLALGLLLEAVLRLLPVQNGPNAALGHPDSDVWFEPGQRFTWSRGWRMRASNELATNNLGFVSAVDYVSDDPRPLVAVVGDSYVQALMIPQGQSLSDLVRERLGPGRRVYSFAASGAPLSQYLVFADLARRRFRPEALVVVVVGNDFDESLRNVKWAPGFHHFVEANDGELELRRRPLPSAPLHATLRDSALVNYLFRNLELRAAPRRLRTAWRTQPDYAGNTRAEASRERIAQSLRVVDVFLKELPRQAGLPPAHIVLVLDALRTAIYAPEQRAPLSRSYFGRMRREIEQRALGEGYQVVDMQPVFEAHYAGHGERFEFPDDGHWNALAHRLCADAVAQRF